MPPTFVDIRKAGYKHQLHYRDVTYFSLSWFDIISTTVMWHTFHYRDVTYFSLPWCDILFTTVMWHTFNYREVTYFSIPWCDILSSTVMWHTFHCRDVTYFSQPWCDILSTTLMWHTLHCRDVTYFPLAWCDILFTTVMRHTFNYWDVTYFPLPWCDILQEISFFSCDQAALQMVFSVRLSVCPSVRHTFFTMFPSSYHHEIFRSYYHGQKWCPCKRSRSEVKGQGHRGQHPTSPFPDSNSSLN